VKFCAVAVSLTLLSLVTKAVANPVGPTVSQGSASFSSQGSHLTVQTSDRTFINWQSFNIGLGETTTFAQPSSSSIVWNQIHDSNPSQILGNLNANGYVFLQNSSGFFVGGQASISAHGFLMTTTPLRMPDLAGGGAWNFTAPPPTASIINYGRINVDRGGSAFLIAHNIENHGTISAPGGSIGLYAGKEVLISERPDGRGLTAKVTLPDGSVDNSGKLVADAGLIAIHSQVVNQGGLIQANSVREINGTIELVASDSVNLTGDSLIQARGGDESLSPGGSVVIKSAHNFTDQQGSTINIGGGLQAGNGGHLEISAPHMTAIKSSVLGNAVNGFLGGTLSIDPENILLTSSGDPAPASGTVNPGDPPSAGSPDTLTIDVNSFSPSLSQINLQATRDIELNTIWTLADSKDPKASLTLQAGRNITLDDGSGIQAGRNWNLNLIAGTELTSAANRQNGVDRIFLQGLAFIQTQNGNISLKAGNDVFVDDGVSDALSRPVFDPSSLIGNGITTAAGGSISVTSVYGDVNTGGNPYAYNYSRTAPYYSVSIAPGELGGISTANGGDVTISAHGNITSHMPLQGEIGDAGSGAFGSQPGNVTITAGGSVFGHFVLANGVGTIAAGQDVGATDPRHAFALSLVKGNWTVDAPNGSIYLQEVRNPNGMFNTVGSNPSLPGWHLFDYDPQSSVALTAGNQVDITGSGVPRPPGTVGFGTLFPPSLAIVAGDGGVVLGNDVTLFPSAFGNLTIASSGSMVGIQSPGGISPTLMMSDSASHKWLGPSSFGRGDHAPSVFELDNPNPVSISVAGDFKDLNLITVKRTVIVVGGQMENSGFSGENLHPGDITSINVAGRIYNTGEYSFAYLKGSILGANPLDASVWDAIFSLAVDPKLIATTVIPTGILPRDLLEIVPNMALFHSGNPGFVYDPLTLRLGFAGRMTPAIRDALESPLEIIRYGPNGLPVVANGHFVTDPVSFVDKSIIASLYQQSQSVPMQPGALGYEIGGPGQFNITAASLELGTTAGVISWGPGSRYNSLTQLTPAGAAINVDLTGDLSMFTSRIVSLYGGDVTVNAGGSIDLGSQELFGSSGDAFGIYTTGHSDVSVTARGDININGSRIAAFNGGNVFVESLEGNVNAGSGGNNYVGVPILLPDPATKLVTSREAYIYGSGVVTTSLTPDYQTPGGNPLPGNITIETPKGDITSSTAGILQVPLNGSLTPGATISLVAGTKGNPGHAGNIDLGDSGVIGGALNLTAEGNITGLIISRQSSTINAAQNFSGTLLSAGTANVNAGGNIAGTIVGIGGVTASGGQGISASLLSQNVSVGGGPSQSTLGSSAAPTATSSAAAASTSSDTKEIALADNSDADKKKKENSPSLVRRVGRVTVLLPPNS
jgi:filamentous hemagglutinin family protein